MMAKFRLITDPEKKYIDQAWIFNDQYFVIDTADREIVDTWYAKNAKNIIYALVGEEVVGFFNVIPLTVETGIMFEENEILEENISSRHILSPEVSGVAQYLYVAAIAVKNRHTVVGNQCVAALISGLCNRIRSLYSPAYLKKMYVNPTTFDGNRFIRKLGLQPVLPKKRNLKAGNDIYALEFDQNTFARLEEIEKRYARFIGRSDWR